MVNFGLFWPKIIQVYVLEKTLRTFLKLCCMAIVLDKIKLPKALSWCKLAVFLPDLEQRCRSLYLRMKVTKFYTGNFLKDRAQ